MSDLVIGENVARLLDAETEIGRLRAELLLAHQHAEKLASVASELVGVLNYLDNWIPEDCHRKVGEAKQRARMALSIGHRVELLRMVPE